jgi:hypothetical protein
MLDSLNALEERENVIRKIHEEGLQRVNPNHENDAIYQTLYELLIKFYKIRKLNIIFLRKCVVGDAKYERTMAELYHQKAKECLFTSLQHLDQFVEEDKMNEERYRRLTECYKRVYEDNENWFNIAGNHISTTFQ